MGTHHKRSHSVPWYGHHGFHLQHIPSKAVNHCKMLVKINDKNPSQRIRLLKFQNLLLQNNLVYKKIPNSLGKSTPQHCSSTISRELSLNMEGSNFPFNSPPPYVKPWKIRLIWQLVGLKIMIDARLWKLIDSNSVTNHKNPET